MYRAEDYEYKVFWSDEDESFVGIAVDFPGLSHLDETQVATLSGIVDVVRHALGLLAEDGKPAPEPLSKQRYTGKFSVRMTPQQHRRLAQEAAEQGVSMNQLLVSRI
jgi:predicted HicB family RNase H-like nuclease